MDYTYSEIYLITPMSVTSFFNFHNRSLFMMFIRFMSLFDHRSIPYPLKPVPWSLRSDSGFTTVTLTGYVWTTFSQGSSPLILHVSRITIFLNTNIININIYLIEIIPSKFCVFSSLFSYYWSYMGSKSKPLIVIK